MQLYKVNIENHIPVSATLIDLSEFEKEKKDLLEADGSIKWIPVFADDEEDSMKVAITIVEDL